jgi:hypothetical protein
LLFKKCPCNFAASSLKGGWVLCRYFLKPIKLLHNLDYMTIPLFFKTKLSAKQGSHATPPCQLKLAGVASLKKEGQ